MIPSSHHAFVVRGHRDSDITHLITETEVYECTRDTFGVDDAREVTLMAHQTPTQQAVRSIVIRSNFLTLEAQNALLKVLEEPPASTRFVMLIPTDMTLLDTIVSRTVELQLAGEVSENEVFRDFLASSYKERITAIETAQKKKDTNWQRSMKDGLITYLQTVKSNDAVLSELEFVSRLLLTRGASNKMLLEHLALSLPTRS